MSECQTFVKNEHKRRKNRELTKNSDRFAVCGIYLISVWLFICGQCIEANYPQ